MISIKTIGGIATAVVLIGSLSLSQAEEAKSKTARPAAKKSDRSSREAIIKRFDKDGDGKNDVFLDQDGDGVNDLSGAFVDIDGDGIPDNIIDHDRDGKNDITGLKYSRDSLKGYRYGRVDEERTKVHREFLDRDADGMNDLIKPAHLRALKRDLFIDEDGDGISDGRRLRLRERTKSRLSKHLKEHEKESPKLPPRRRPTPKREKSREKN